MSCQDCERIQQENKQGKNCAFLRVGNGNVLVGACDKHFNQLRAQMGLMVETDAPVTRMLREGV